MIQIVDKKDCCGCGACVQRCPKLCLTMHEDGEGFLYPEVTQPEHCIHCGLCQSVCPVINPSQPCRPMEVHAAKNSDEQVRMSSSSGGVFSMLAEQTIRQGGVVFGARFDERWEAVHDYAETLEGLEAFRGSKYVQSRIGRAYYKVEGFLRQGRRVLFSGTPCQTAGLKNFLRKEYEGLLCVDIVCHGVPSPKVWREYLSQLKPASEIRGVNFRDKSGGWKRYSLHITGAEGFSLLQPYTENTFMQGFSHDLYLRPSCYACPAKGGRSQSDITLGDFWGVHNVHPSLNDNKGVSAVLVRTQKGRDAFMQLGAESVPSRYEDVLKENPSLEHSAPLTEYRSAFFAQFPLNGFDVIRKINAKLRPNILKRSYRTARTALRTVMIKLHLLQ